MKLLRLYFFPGLIVLAGAALPACKAKKLAQPAPVAENYPPAPQTKPAPVAAPAPAPSTAPAPVAPPAPNYNFANIQFEFNSGILKTVIVRPTVRPTIRATLF